MSVGRKALEERELAEIMKRTREKMENPPDNCERCKKVFGRYNRQWDGNRWLCDYCAEETAQ